MRFEIKDGALIAHRQGEMLRVEAWGIDALRVRATRYPQLTGENWALTEAPAPVTATITQTTSPVVDGSTEAWRVTNGHIACEVNSAGVLSFFRNGTLILREHFRNYEGTVSRESHCLKMEGRMYKAHIGGDCSSSSRDRGGNDPAG